MGIGHTKWQTFLGKRCEKSIFEIVVALNCGQHNQQLFLRKLKTQPKSDQEPCRPQQHCRLQPLQLALCHINHSLSTDHMPHPEISIFFQIVKCNFLLSFLHLFTHPPAQDNEPWCLRSVRGLCHFLRSDVVLS